MGRQTQPGSLQEAQAMLKDQKKLKELLASAEVRQLAQALSAGGGKNLSAAVQSAKNGDTGQLEQMVKSLSSTREGARLISQLQGRLDS